MSYRFRFSQPVGAEFRRIADEQIALCFDAASPASRAGNVPHEIRKHCKKLRALFRLVRGAFPDYRREQHVVRDAGRALAAVRDVDVRLETLARLREHAPGRHRIPALDAAEAWLRSLQRSEATANGQAEAVERALSLLAAQRARLSSWRLDADGFDAVSEGLAQTYRKARTALAEARRQPTPERLHELRKYAKHHRFHLELLRGLWKGPIGAVIGEAEDIGQLLGQHHDLHVLIRALSHDAPAASRLDEGWLMALVEPETRQFERQSIAMAQRLFAEKPSRFCARFATYWDACAEAGAKHPA